MVTSRETMDKEVRKYLEFRIDDLKLKTVDGLCVGVSRVFSLMVAIMLGAIVIASFAFGAVLLLGDIIGSWAGAAFIIGGFFLIILAVVLLLWKRLFTNLFVRLFISIFYESE